jgi:hypothetical protein
VIKPCAIEGSREEEEEEVPRLFACSNTRNGFMRACVEQPYFNLEARMHNGFQLRKNSPAFPAGNPLEPISRPRLGYHPARASLVLSPY